MSTSLALACRLGAGSPVPSIPRRVRSILRKYGATLLMPGPAVPILGPELIAGGSFDSAAGWTLGANTAISGGILTISGATTISSYAAPVNPAAQYLVAFQIAAQTNAGTGVRVRPGGTVAGTYRTAMGSYSEVVTATASGTSFNIDANATGWQGSIDNVSVREIVGYQNTYASFAAGNYKESTGNTLAGIDQQVGLVIDASQDAGPELMSNGDFAAGLTAWTVYANGGTAEATGGVATVTSGGTNGRIEQAKTLTANKTYIATAYVTLGTAPNMQLECIRGAAGSYASLGKFVATTPGRQLARFVFVATGADVIVQAKSANGAGTFTIEKVSLRELPGIHASQSTSGYQPYLRQVPKTLGPELLSADGSGGSVAGWSTKLGGALSSVAGRLRLAVPAGNADRAVSLAIPTVAGKDYAVSMSGYLGTLAGYWILRAASSEDGVTTLAQTSARTDSGVAAQVVFKGTGDNVHVAFIAVGSAVGQYGEFDDVSVREVLDWTYAWQFDGTDDRFPLASLPLASGDDFYQAFALRCTTSGANKTFADLLTNPTTGTRLGCLRINGANALQVVHANDGGGVNTVAGRTILDGQLLVVEALRVGTNHTVCADGVVDIQTTLSGSYTTTHATIGARGAGTSEPFLGYMHGAIVCKGAPSDDERAILLKFLAKLQGRTL